MNTNCLKGMMCPQCGHTESFDILVTCVATLTDDGTTNERNPDWDRDSPCYCNGCDWEGKVRHTPIPGFRVTFEIYTDLGYEMGEADRRGWWMPGEWLFDECPDELAFEFDPEYYDPEEHESLDEAVVEWAVALLWVQGVTHPNQDPSDDATWWSTEDEDHDYATGAKIGKAFHFVGFSDDLRQRINRGMAS